MQEGTKFQIIPYSFLSSFDEEIFVFYYTFLFAVNIL